MHRLLHTTDEVVQACCKARTLRIQGRMSPLPSPRVRSDRSSAEKPSVRVDEDRASDGALNRHLGLIALEHDPWKCLQHADRGAGCDPEGRKPLGASGQIARDARDSAAPAGRELCE
jgi:hypothetical protein